MVALAVQGSLRLQWVAKAAGAGELDPAFARGLGAYLLEGPGGDIAAILFAVGSTRFAFLGSSPESVTV